MRVSYLIELLKNTNITYKTTSNVSCYDLEDLYLRATKEDGIQRIPSSFVSRIFTRRTPDKFSQTKIYHNVRTVSAVSICIIRTFGFWVPQGSNPPTEITLSLHFTHVWVLSPSRQLNSSNQLNSSSQKIIDNPSSFCYNNSRTI